MNKSNFNPPPLSLSDSYLLVWMAPTVLDDDRETSTYEHATFNEILNLYKTTGISRQVFVHHYGLENEKPNISC